MRTVYTGEINGYKAKRYNDSPVIYVTIEDTYRIPNRTHLIVYKNYRDMWVNGFEPTIEYYEQTDAVQAGVAYLQELGELRENVDKV